MKRILLIGNEYDTAYVRNQIRNITKYRLLEYNNIDYISYEYNEIKDLDYIIIAISELSVARKVYNSLSQIEEIKDNIMDFFSIAYASVPQMTADRVMLNPLVKEFECIVLGISHAEVGVIPELMPTRTANLASSSQDIYFNHEVLKYCIEKYGDKLKKVNKVFIDMYDYTYFNFDTSKSSVILNYYGAGGILLPHNFEKNKIYKEISFDERFINYIKSLPIENITNSQLDIWDELFGNYVCGPPMYKGYRNKPFIELKRDVLDFHKNDTKINYDAGIIKTRHNETILENKYLMKELFRTIFTMNPNMEVHLFITPFFKSASKKISEEMLFWKKEFYEVLEEMHRDYSFTFSDFRYDEMSEYKEYFYDEGHLNYFGAQLFTKKLLEV